MQAFRHQQIYIPEYSGGKDGEDKGSDHWHGKDGQDTV